MDNQMNLHIEMPQIQYTDRVADDSVAVPRQVAPRTTETKHRIVKLMGHIFKLRLFKLIDLAHDITSVNVAKQAQAYVARRCFNEGGSRGKHREQQHEHHIS